LRPKLNHLKKIKVGAVSYLNTKPLLYGIKHHNIFQRIELIEDYPSHIAQLLIDNKIDLGLIPVAAIPRLKEHHIITDYCIGANGAVASVCLFSQVPLNEVQKVFLDYQSKTSVSLAKILLRDYWKQKVQFIDATGEDFRNQIQDATAGVVIGDRALQQRKSSKYTYDLGEAWKKHTGLPFVFAVWVANKKLSDDFIADFNEANALGFQHLEKVILGNAPFYFDLNEYYTRYISYSLDDEKKRGMSLFLKLLGEI
jgi:chorismate dehydratase